MKNHVLPALSYVQRKGLTYPIFLRDLLRRPLRNRSVKQELRPGRNFSAERFKLRKITAQHDDPRYLGEWRRLLLEGASADKIYQTPEFFRFLLKTSDRTDRFELYAICREPDGAVVGMLPVRLRRQQLPFRLGFSALASPTVSLVTVLGSIPLMHENPMVVGQVFREMLKEFPDAVGLCMPAVPAGHPVYGQGDDGNLAGFFQYVLDGWRDCHTLPLPREYDSYLQKLSAKKRYNLTRQVRMLSQAAGPVALTRVVASMDVAGMMAALEKVVPADQLRHILSSEKFLALAENNLLLSYVISCGEIPVAVVVGTRSTDTWHVHNIFVDQKYLNFSIGTSAIQLALRDVIENFTFVCADFGYGAPNSDFRSTHVLQKRGIMLLCPAYSKAHVLFRVHQGFDGGRNRLLRFAKSMLKSYGMKKLA